LWGCLAALIPVVLVSELWELRVMCRESSVRFVGDAQQLYSSTTLFLPLVLVSELWELRVMCRESSVTFVGDAQQHYTLFLPLVLVSESSGFMSYHLGRPEPYIYRVYTVFLAGISSNTRSCTAYIYIRLWPTLLILP